MQTVPPILHVRSERLWAHRGVTRFEECAAGKNMLFSISTTGPLTNSVPEHVGSLDAFRALLKDSRIRAVVFHSLPPNLYPYLDAVPDKVRVAWIGVGYDYLGALLHEGPRAQLERKTVEFAIQNGHIKRRSVWGPFGPYRYARDFKYYRTCRASLSRVDVFSPVLPVEGIRIRRANPWFSARQVDWNYPVGLTRQPITGQGAGVLVGNSGALTNNHIDAFQAVSGFAAEQTRVVVPLSYGGGSNLREQIAAVAHKTFPERCDALTSFVSESEYYQTISSCGTAVMNHVRQKGFGTIILALGAGMRIFLNGRSPLLPFLKEFGLDARDIGEFFLDPMSGRELRNQKEGLQALLEQIYSLRRTQELINNLI